MRKSKTELSTPNSTMKRPMKRMSQRRGRSTSSGSTLSSAMPTAGTSDRKLLSRICPASSGRNGRNSEAAAMLTMLPRFALVVVRMYLSVLANVLRPSSMPRRITSRLRSSRTKSAASLRHVHRLLHRQARVRRVHGRRVVHAVAQEADHVAHLLERRE